MKKTLFLAFCISLFFLSCNNDSAADNTNTQKEEHSTASVDADEAENKSSEEESKEDETIYPKTDLLQKVTQYASVKDLMQKGAKPVKDGAPLTLVSKQGMETHPLFSQEDIDALFSSAPVFSGEVIGVVDVGSFLVLHLKHSNNMASEENLVTWDKKEQKVISSLNLTAAASTSYYSFESKTTALSDNLFEVVERTEDFNDGSTKEEKKQYKLDTDTGEFLEVK